MRLNIGIWLVLLGIKIMPRTEGKRASEFLSSLAVSKAETNE